MARMNKREWVLVTSSPNSICFAYPKFESRRGQNFLGNIYIFFCNITSYRFCLITSNKNWRSDKVYVTFGIGHMYMSPLSQLHLVWGIIHSNRSRNSSLLKKVSMNIIMHKYYKVSMNEYNHAQVLQG